MADINEIISQEALKGLERAEQLTTELANSLLKIATDAQKADASLTAIGKSTGSAADKAKQLSDAQKEQERIAKEQAKTLADLDRQRQRALQTLGKQEAKEREYAEVINKQAKSIEELNKQNKALIDARNKVDVTTKEGQKQIKELNKQIDANNKTLKENSSSLEKQKINIGNYISSWGPFQGVARIVQQGIAIMKIAFASLKAAIISTGIGALVVALASLFTYFQRTERGAEAFKKIMVGFKAVFDVLIDRFVKFGEAIYKFFTGDFKGAAEDIRGVFKGIGDEIEREYNLMRQLQTVTEQIEDARIAATVATAENRREIQRLLEIARDEQYTTQQRLAAWQQANTLSRENIRIEEYLNKMELDNEKQKYETTERTEEQRKKLVELQVKMIEAETSAQSEINSLIKLGNKLRREAAEEQERIAREALKITGMKSLDPLIQIEQEKTQITLDGIAARTEAEEAAHQRTLERIEEERQRRIDAAADYTSQIAAIGETMLSFSQFILDQESQKIEQRYRYEMQLAGENELAKEAAQKRYDKERSKLATKQAKQDKTAAIFRAVIGTAQAVIQGLAFGPPLGYVFAALNAALGAVQIALIASQPIPQYAKGTRSARKGLAMVGERGRELILGPDGSVALTPSTASLVNLGRGGHRIIPNAETELLLRAAKGADDEHSRRMMNQIHDDNLRLIETVKNKKELHISADGRRITERQGSYYKNYLNKKIRL